MKPVLFVVAGPDGAGKTTVTTRLRQDHWSDGVTYLNPDEVAQERFAGWNDPAEHHPGGSLDGEKRERLLLANEGIAFETVFSMPDKLDFIARARQRGFFARAFFVGTEDPTINAARVTRRALEGGHTVPIEKVISRYERSILNLVSLIDACDRTY